MEKYIIDRFEAPGRHTSIIHRRLAQQRENHFVKKLTKAVLKPSIKKAEKEIAQKVGAEKAAEMVKTAMETDSAKKAVSKTNKIGTAAAIISAVGGAAVAAPALGIGAGVGGAGGGSAAAAAAAKDAAKAAGPLLATTRKPTSDITKPVPVTERAVTPLTDQAKEYLGSTGINAPGVIEELQKLEKSKTVQTVKNIADLMPADVKKQLRNKLKGSRASLGDIVANNPMSKELLPYNRETKELVERASKEAVTDASKNKEPEFSFSSPWFIGAMVLAVIIALAVVFKN